MVSFKYRNRVVCVDGSIEICWQETTNRIGELVKGGHDFNSLKSTLEEAFGNNSFNSQPYMPQKRGRR